MMTKLYRAMQPSFDKSDVLVAISEDWVHDARGANAMDFPMLSRALFELADNWCVRSSCPPARLRQQQETHRPTDPSAP